MKSTGINQPHEKDEGRLGMWQGRLTSLDLPYINARALKQVRILERPNRSCFGRGLAAGPH